MNTPPNRAAQETGTALTVILSATDMESLQRLAEELGATPRDTLRQLAAHGRQGWPWLLGLDLRHQLRTLLMQRLRRADKRIGFKLPRLSDED